MAEPQLDVAAFYAALDERRRSAGVSWRTLAAEAKVSPSTLSRMAQGKRPDVDSFAKLVRWLGVAADLFLTGKESRSDDTFAVISSHLRASKQLTPEAADALEQILKAALTALRQQDRE